MRKKILLIFCLMTFSYGGLLANSFNVPQNYLPIGINLSYSNGYQIGGEISYVHYEGVWYGFYADSIYNLTQKESKFSLGPELGFGFFGTDFGFLAAERDNKMHPGITGRILASCIAVHAYVRADYIFKVETSFEFGLLFKLPFIVSR